MLTDKYTKESVHYEWETESPVTALSGILLYQYDVVLPPRISNGTVVRWSGNCKSTLKFFHIEVFNVFNSLVE